MAPTASEIKKFFGAPCTFMRGATRALDFPKSPFPEFAFVGRSNVGKSSLLNSLTGQKALARVSKTPGRTQQINFFNMGDRLVLADLPGYGYAKVPKALKQEWEGFILDYLSKRENLLHVFVLVDARHPIKPSDLEVIQILEDLNRPLSLVLTKIDSVKKSELENHVKILQKTMAGKNIYPVSSKKGDGIMALQKTILTSL